MKDKHLRALRSASPQVTPITESAPPVQRDDTGKQGGTEWVLEGESRDEQSYWAHE
jgi:hypothetical protein